MSKQSVIETMALEICKFHGHSAEDTSCPRSRNEARELYSLIAPQIRRDLLGTSDLVHIIKEQRSGKERRKSQRRKGNRRQ